MSRNDSWKKVRFDEICKNVSDRIDNPKQAKTDYYVGLEHIDSENPKISRHGSPQDVGATKLKFKTGQILFGKRRWYLRKLAVTEREGICSAHMMVLESIKDKIKKEFLPILMQGDNFFEKAISVSVGSLSPTIKWKDLAPMEFHIPSIPEQENILSVMQKIDNSISNTQNLLEKTKNYAISRRESLLTKGIGHIKFKKVPWLFGKEIEIPEEWDIKKIGECCNILDSKRIPINSEKRKKIQGNIPYYGANGIQGYVNDHIFDEELILLAEDGGYFDEYETRPIAQYVVGKCWVNNHAHVLNAKNNNFLKWIFYSLVHKNITSYINGSTRTKLNQLDLRQVSLLIPPLPEQQKIASILSNIQEQITRQQSHLTNLKVLRKSILNSKLTKEKTNVTN